MDNSKRPATGSTVKRGATVSDQDDKSQHSNRQVRFQSPTTVWHAQLPGADAELASHDYLRELRKENCRLRLENVRLRNELANRDGGQV